MFALPQQEAVPSKERKRKRKLWKTCRRCGRGGWSKYTATAAMRGKFAFLASLLAWLLFKVLLTANFFTMVRFDVDRKRVGRMLPVFAFWALKGRQESLRRARRAC